MLMNSNEYIEIIETIKSEIIGAQYKAALHVNRELVMLYYHIGKVINEHKTWGNKFIENLANCFFHDSITLLFLPIITRLWSVIYNKKGSGIYPKPPTHFARLSFLNLKNYLHPLDIIPQTEYNIE